MYGYAWIVSSGGVCKPLTIMLKTTESSQYQNITRSDLDSTCNSSSLQVDFRYTIFCVVTERPPLTKMPIWPYGLRQNESNVPGFYKKTHATQSVIPVLLM